MLRLIGILTMLCLSKAVFADTFEVQGGYRSARSNDWKGNEFMIHYLGEDISNLSFGAYFSSSFWDLPERKKAQVIEGGPEIRWQHDLENFSSFLGLQYALLSSGEGPQDVGLRVQGPRLLAALIFPFEQGFIFNIGISKGFEKLTITAESKTHTDFSSVAFFVGASL